MSSCSGGRKNWPFLAFMVAVAAPGLACHPGADLAGVPLYPNSATTRLPRNQLAQVSGPIREVDGQNVMNQGGVYDLLPGCHVVELDRRVRSDPYALSGGTYFTGEYPVTIYAMRMKAGARYVIRREIVSDGQMGRMDLSAREEEASGAVADLFPVKSADEIAACKQAAAPAPGG